MSNPSRVIIHQQHYIQRLLEKFKMVDAKPVHTPVAAGFVLSKQQDPKNEAEKKEMEQIPYRMLVGCLLWIANWTRPDIAFATSMVSQFLVNPGPAHWVAAKRVLRYLKGTSDLGIVYTSSMESKTKISMHAWSDSDWAANTDTRRSVTAYCISMAGSVFTWASKKQSVMALSSTEAEYTSTICAVHEIMHMRSLLASLDYPQQEATVLNCDNQSAILLAKNLVMHGRTRHIDVKLHFIRKVIEDGEIKIEYVSTAENRVDVLTKSLPRAKHEEHVVALGIVKIPSVAAAESKR